MYSPARMQQSPSPPPRKINRPSVLIGLMGTGKSTVGKRLAARLHLPFVDADHEIEHAAGLGIPEIFARYGEAEFLLRPDVDTLWDAAYQASVGRPAGAFTVTGPRGSA